MALRGSSLLRLLLISLGCAFLNALDLLPSEKRFEGIQGDKITLDCKFTLLPEDTGTLDIEWFLVAPDAQQADKMIISFTGVLYPQDGPLKGRVDFVSPTPEEGDASIIISNLKESDSGTYQCKVKKLPGSQNKKVALNVYVKPARTRCFIEGKQEIGQDLNLKCQANEGSSPLTYTWQKISGLGKKFLTSSLLHLDVTGGILHVKNATQEYSGTYRCSSKNRVGTDECLVILSVVPPSNTAGIIAGAVIGTLLFLIVLAILIFFCCRKQKEKKYEKEIQHEIREDVAPPKSRNSTARSYIGSNIGSNNSSLGSLSPSNMDGYSKARYNQVPSVPSEEMEKPPSQAPSQAPNYVPPKVAGPNLSRMGAIPVMIPAQCKDGSIV
ncbi:LOW QUALITY PROTEIN: coxsackievirus and adenovirus receptor [Bufo gargarizans]|uniref:LOW QUALITY PROTEIN: coxsackievirus and adenovirus receptor n=1 Tax=Bufo gargarizans TaxID=30331 RepID=UPI001CF33D17|nr:LOW QUALITY PROTEIN: coxsackievirus and adenovirus receptor [Bufo gargarizans]